MKLTFVILLLISCVIISGCMGNIVVDRRGSTNTQDNQNGPITTDSSSTNQQSALSDYEAKISIVSIEQGSLQSYIESRNSFVNIDEYKSWMDVYKQRLDSYTSICYDEIAAGQKYKTYLDVGSTEYNRVISNEATINNDIKTYNEAYNQQSADYNRKRVISTSLSNYNNKLALVTSTQKDMQNYVNAAGSFSDLSKEWVDGYGEKVNSYTDACDQAVCAGRDLQQYYTIGTTEYNQISQTETDLLHNENTVRTSYNELKAGNEDFQSFVSAVKFIAPLMSGGIIG
jgi:hypothetical protein